MSNVRWGGRFRFCLHAMRDREWVVITDPASAPTCVIISTRRGSEGAVLFETRPTTRSTLEQLEEREQIVLLGELERESFDRYIADVLASESVPDDVKRLVREANGLASKRAKQRGR